MQTTATLTETDITLLTKLKSKQQRLITTWITIGGVLSLVAALLLNGSFYDRALLPPALMVLIIGAAILILVLRMKKALRTNNRYLINNNTKMVITDRLLRIEPVRRTKMRYHFTHHYIDLNIPIPRRRKPLLSINNDSIDSAGALTGMPITLSYIEYEPGVLILLGIHYNQLPHDESVAPVLPTDKKTIFMRDMVGFIPAGITIFIISLPTGFADIAHPNIIQMLLVLCILLTPVIGRILYRRWIIQRSYNKIVVRSTITERLTILVPSNGGKSTKQKTYYRISDGGILSLPEDIFKAGDLVQFQYLEDKHYEKGILIDIVRL